jgi:GTP-binding protein HflX
VITVFNKADLLSEKERQLVKRKDHYCVSAKTGLGLKELLAAIEQKLDADLVEVSISVPHDKHAVMADIYRTAHIIYKNATATGTDLRLRIDPANWKKITHDLSQ